MNKIHTLTVNGEKYELLDADAVKRTTDKLCPSFSESGDVVQCKPVEEHPMHVTTELPETEEGIAEITLVHCGKNLYDNKEYPLDDTQESDGRYLHYYHDTGKRAGSNTYCSNKKLIPVGHLKGKAITLNHAPVEQDKSAGVGMCFYSANNLDAFIAGAGGNGHTYTVPTNAEYMGFTVSNKYMDGTQIQIEIGDTVTEYEPFRGQEIFTAEFPESVHDWGEIPGMAGTNVLFSSVGTTVVKGKADPVAIIDALSKTVSALLEG